VIVIACESNAVDVTDKRETYQNRKIPKAFFQGTFKKENSFGE